MATKIEWVRNDDGTQGETWNPVIGCSRVSEGCRHCYAETMAGRLARMGQGAYEGLTTGTGRKTRWTGVVRCLPERLGVPLGWKKPRRIFVNSMSDLFHESVPFEFTAAVFGVMAACPQHTFQVLTKRPERAVGFFKWVERTASEANVGFGLSIPEFCLMEAGADVDVGAAAFERVMSRPAWPLPNVHLGVSVEDQPTADKRIPLLLQCPAAVRWVSAEPLLGAVDLGNFLPLPLAPERVWRSCDCDDIDPSDRPCFVCEAKSGVNWVVVGGESGHGARPMHPDWVRSLRDQCADAGVPFLFKQWGAHDETGVRVGKKAAGRLLDGRLHDEYPGR